MLNNDELVLFLDGVADQIEAGINLSEAIMRMASSFNKHKEPLLAVASEMANGYSFGSLLPKYDLLPESIWSQIILGEQTGCLDEVMHELSEHNSIYFKQVKKTMSALKMPIGIMIGAVMAFVGFMLFIFPIYGKGLPLEQRESGVFYLSSLFVDVYKSAPWVYALPFVAIVYIYHLSKRNKNFKDAIFNLSLKFPFYGEGVKKMLLSGWCTNTAIGIRAGMNVFEAITLSNRGLAQTMISAFDFLVRDVELRGWSYAINSKNWAEDDPRESWPLPLVTAIDVGGELNKLDVTLKKASIKLMETSQRDIDKGVGLATTIATIFAVTCIVGLAASLILAQTASYKAIGGGM